GLAVCDRLLPRPLLMTVSTLLENMLLTSLLPSVWSSNRTAPRCSGGSCDHRSRRPLPSKYECETPFPPAPSAKTMPRALLSKVDSTRLPVVRVHQIPYRLPRI